MSNQEDNFIMKKLLLAGVAALGLSFGAMADDNVAYVMQSGNNHTNDQYQTGQRNNAYATQSGSYNENSQRQTGNDNRANVAQTGTRNTAAQAQSGSRNNGNGTWYGAGAVIDQRGGSYNAATQNQGGNENAARALQIGGTRNRIEQTQSGNENNAHATQDNSTDSRITQRQHGLGSTVIAYQGSAANSIIEQTQNSGYRNTADSKQEYGSNMRAYITQGGGDWNRANTDQRGHNLTATAMQSGSNNTSNQYQR